MPKKIDYDKHLPTAADLREKGIEEEVIVKATNLTAAQWKEQQDREAGEAAVAEYNANKKPVATKSAFALALEKALQK